MTIEKHPFITWENKYGGGWNGTWEHLNQGLEEPEPNNVALADVSSTHIAVFLLWLLSHFEFVESGTVESVAYDRNVKEVALQAA